MFGFLSRFIRPKEYVIKPLSLLGWRNNMWVMTPDGIGIIFELGVESKVHLTDAQGLTILERVYPTQALRQAKLKEIPKERLKCSKAQANALGYF